MNFSTWKGWFYASSTILTTFINKEFEKIVMRELAIEF
jgi:hypothetical protein